MPVDQRAQTRQYGSKRDRLDAFASKPPGQASSSKAPDPLYKSTLAYFRNHKSQSQISSSSRKTSKSTTRVIINKQQISPVYDESRSLLNWRTRVQVFLTITALKLTLDMELVRVETRILHDHCERGELADERPIIHTLMKGKLTGLESVAALIARPSIGDILDGKWLPVQDIPNPNPEISMELCLYLALEVDFKLWDVYSGGAFRERLLGHTVTRAHCTTPTSKRWNSSPASKEHPHSPVVTEHKVNFSGSNERVDGSSGSCEGLQDSWGKKRLARWKNGAGRNKSWKMQPGKSTSRRPSGPAHSLSRFSPFILQRITQSTKLQTAKDSPSEGTRNSKDRHGRKTHKHARKHLQESLLRESAGTYEKLGTRQETLPKRAQGNIKEINDDMNRFSSKSQELYNCLWKDAIGLTKNFELLRDYTFKLGPAESSALAPDSTSFDLLEHMLEKGHNLTFYIVNNLENWDVDVTDEVHWELAWDNFASYANSVNDAYETYIVKGNREDEETTKIGIEPQHSPNTLSSTSASSGTTDQDRTTGYYNKLPNSAKRRARKAAQKEKEKERDKGHPRSSSPTRSEARRSDLSCPQLIPFQPPPTIYGSGTHPISKRLKQWRTRKLHRKTSPYHHCISYYLFYSCPHVYRVLCSTCKFSWEDGTDYECSLREEFEGSWSNGRIRELWRAFPHPCKICPWYDYPALPKTTGVRKDDVGCSDEELHNLRVQGLKHTLSYEQGAGYLPVDEARFIDAQVLQWVKPEYCTVMSSEHLLV